MDQEHDKGNGFRARWMFRQKDCRAKEPVAQSAASKPGDRQDSLRELSVRWFMDTQAPLILQNGIFPSWFQGFITRKDAEQTLHGKELGSFLIRLSDKATGYILSYKGRGRCRHFMISQSKTGQFIVSGDTQPHESLTDLIEFYKINPIEPFGEYLTFSGLEECAEELYDMIQVSHREEPPVSARGRKPAIVAPQSHRKQEGTPPIPRRRGAHVNGCASDRGGSPCGRELTHTNPGRPSSRSSSREGTSEGRASWLETDKSTTSSRPPLPPLPHLPPHHLLLATTTATATQPNFVYSLVQPLEGKSTSLPLLLDTHSVGDKPHMLGTPPPQPSPRTSPGSAGGAGCVRGRQKRGKTPGGGGAGGRAGDNAAGGGGSNRPVSSHSLDYLHNRPLYHMATASQLQAHDDDIDERLLVRNEDGVFDDDAYEPLPGDDGASRRDSHTYESLEDLRPKPVASTAGAKKDKWKWFPEWRK
ncbi:hypothetical protein NHX12_003234 [Muraenolepis orangiensis]|uniref:SH2 domain-containing protein n=1 Tax=Muraenolepis orangiensis TaxID=630683 RepID=A0A9Q0DYL3_9TELE|nr:hypothetical protein NHX12_003234 [Muraenolepis orangiensis]